MQGTDLVRSLAGEGAILVFDRASVRTFDSDGHLHVADTNISKATINGYYGREIPDYKKLGLDANRVYQMLRCPEELAKGASTFDGKPLMFQHKPINAHDHAHNLVVGAISNPRFESPFLKAKITVWPGTAIDAIQNDEQKELSCGYKYRPDMTPGTYAVDGVEKAYDGVMRDIVGNHVALVKEGRAGPDVVVGDSMENFHMTTRPQLSSRSAAVALGALMVHLRPKLAQDAKVDLAPVLKGVTAENFKTEKTRIATDIKKVTDKKLAKDANLDDVMQLLDSLEDVMPAGGAEDVDPNESEEDKKKRLAAIAAAKEKAGKQAADEKARADRAEAEMKEMVTKGAMDAAITAAVDGAQKTAAANAIKLANEIREAERAVRPYVGELAQAFDSADGVYRAALDTLGVKDLDKVHPSAFPHILAAQPKAEDRARQTNVTPFAADAAAAKGFAERFPGAGNIKLAG